MYQTINLSRHQFALFCPFFRLNEDFSGLLHWFLSFLVITKSKGEQIGDDSLPISKIHNIIYKVEDKVKQDILLIQIRALTKNQKRLLTIW